MRKREKNRCRIMDSEFIIPHSELHIPHSKGFTLIEAIMTIVIVGIISGIAAVIILQAMKATTKERNLSDAHYHARLAVERMARELRSMQSCATMAVSANPGGTLSFIDINSSTTVTFSVSGTDLRRISPSGTDLLASGITSAQPFSLLAANGTTLTTACPGVWFINISVTDTQGADSLTMRTRVHPRNF